MVVGIVIGSGVFFKAQNVLNLTNGNMPLGILAWLIGGAIMICCAYCFAILATKYKHLKQFIDNPEQYHHKRDDKNKNLIDFVKTEHLSIEDVVDGVPNRHGVAHSWYPKYPSQKAALNAILLTDFVINLKPKKKEIPEDKSNGQTENAQP